MRRRDFLRNLAAAAAAGGLCNAGRARAAEPADAPRAKRRPNFLFLFTDDQRYDALGCAGNRLIHTPALDSLAERGLRFDRAFVTLSICSPSRAASLTGRYGSANGVVTVYRGPALNPGERTFAQILKAAGYQTGFVGKWHLKQRPNQVGFDSATYFTSNGPYYGRTVFEDGKRKKVPGYIEDYNADRAVRFLRQAAQRDAPWVLWHCTQIPHMNHKFDWPAREPALQRYPQARMPVPKTWQDDLAGKPPYLKTERSRQRALQYGYDKKEAIQRHFQRYYAAITEMDATLGRVLAELDRLKLRANTYVIFLSDNGWFIGDHGFTSKVLPYETSMRVPMIAAGPGVRRGVESRLVLNIDVCPTLLELAGIKVPANVHGRSLAGLLTGQKDVAWRGSFLYEAPKSQLGSRPLLAVRTARWKYIRTYKTPACREVVFEELYDLDTDPDEMTNLADDKAHAERKAKLVRELVRLRREIA